MYYIDNSTTCQQNSEDVHELSSKRTKQYIEAMLAHLLPVDPSVPTPIEEPIAADKFATTPIHEVSPNPKDTKGYDSAGPLASVTGPSTPLTTPLPSLLFITPNHLHSPSIQTQSVTKPTAKKSRWRGLDEFQMLQAGIEAAKRVGGYTFSLNLGIGRESSLLNSDDPARLLSHNISREFRRIIGHDLPYGFILELAPDEPGFGRLHSHGVFVPGDANIEKIEQALIRAGGKIEAGGWAKKQLVVKPITDALGWADYITKAKRWKKARPRGRHHFLSRPLNQIARLDFEEFGLGEASSVRRVF